MLCHSPYRRFLKDVAEAKNAVHEMAENELSPEELSDESVEKITDSLGAQIDTQDEIYHTAVLLDDCQDRFIHRTPRNAELWRLLFENRQPKITYFLTMQDPKGIDTSLKENLDSAWLFGGFSYQKFKYLLRNIQNDYDSNELWDMYRIMCAQRVIISVIALFLQFSAWKSHVK